MKTTIQKRLDFDAAHSLDFLPPDHKCARVHGHTYVVDIEVQGEPDQFGMLVDYGDLTAPIMAELDHRNLNDVPGLQYPTTENVAKWILHRLQRVADAHAKSFHPPLGAVWRVSRVRVHESSSTWAEVVG